MWKVGRKVECVRYVTYRFDLTLSLAFLSINYEIFYMIKMYLTALPQWNSGNLHCLIVQNAVSVVLYLEIT